MPSWCAPLPHLLYACASLLSDYAQLSEADGVDTMVTAYSNYLASPPGQTLSHSESYEEKDGLQLFTTNLMPICFMTYFPDKLL